MSRIGRDHRRSAPASDSRSAGRGSTRAQLEPLGELGQPPLEKPPLRLLPREREGALVRGAGVRRSPEPPAQLRARGVRETVVQQIAALEDGVDERQTRRRAVAHRHRDRAVQLDHRGGVRSRQHVVEADDLRPVGRGGGRRLGVHRRDRRLNRVRADPPRRQRPLHEPRALRDLIPVPQRAVLIVEQDQLARRRRARRAPRFVQQHQRQQPSASGSGSSSTSSRPRRIASAERSCRVSDAPEDAA